MSMNHTQNTLQNYQYIQSIIKFPQNSQIYRYRQVTKLFYEKKQQKKVIKVSAGFTNVKQESQRIDLSKEEQILQKLKNIIDPDLSQDIVSLGFVQNLKISDSIVKFDLELTTPACPVKDDFRNQADQFVRQLDWVSQVDVNFTAQPRAQPNPNQKGLFKGQNDGCLSQVKNIIAVSSCKGGVGKSTVAVNLAFTLTQMGAKVGILDADVYGPSLPTMISPEEAVLEMVAGTKEIKPVEFMGVKCVSFGFANQGSAIMRGAMVAGLIQQLLTTSQWGQLDYLIVDFPPGTGDIQLTMCQAVQFTSAVVVTTPQRLAAIDVAKGVRMFARLMIPCVAVVENMSFFDGDDGKRYFPFGKGSGKEVAETFGIPNIFYFPIIPALSAAGDGGVPLVVSDPSCATSSIFQDLGAKVVQEVAKLQHMHRTVIVKYIKDFNIIYVKFPRQIEGGKDAFYSPLVIRNNDTSAKKTDQLTGMKTIQKYRNDTIPIEIKILGNYALYFMWDDGQNQVASYHLLQNIPQIPQSELNPYMDKLNLIISSLSSEVK